MKLTSLIEKTETELVALGKSSVSKIGGACHTLGKIIFALGTFAPRDIAMGKFVLQAFGLERADVPRQAWSVAVCAAYIAEDGGPGKFAEEHFDKTPARWLAVASAIYNTLERDEQSGKLDAATAAGYREQIAGVVRERPANGQTILESLRNSLKPQGGEGEGGQGEGEGQAGTGEDVEPLESQAMASLIATANLIGQASFDAVQIRALRRTFVQVGKLIRLKTKAAAPAPIAPVTVEHTVAGPILMPATAPEEPARMVSMAAALEAAQPAPRRAGRKRQLAAA